MGCYGHFPLPSLIQAIEGYKETEKIKWSEANQPVIARFCARQGTADTGGDTCTGPGS